MSLPSALYEKKATLYCDNALAPKAAILYFHGGGLIYGSRGDLPARHLETFCSKGYAVIALDYPLAPGAKIPVIIDDVKKSIEWYIESRGTILQAPLPYFLWGRSAGAYLCLLMLKEKLSEMPAGILSYYGYGLLCDGWFNSQSPFYSKYPPVSEACLSVLSQGLCANRHIDEFFVAYVFLRQTGKWSSVFYDGDEDSLLVGFSLRGFKPESDPPVFLAHSTNDPDVPFSEYCRLSNLLSDSSSFTVSLPAHDFDRDAGSAETKRLLSESLNFLNSALERKTSKE